jgi:Flp pilus assembly protein TadD
MFKLILRVVPAVLPIAIASSAYAAGGGPVDPEIAAKKMMIEEALVNCYREKGDLPDAATEYKKLLLVEPNNARAHFDYANVLLRLQRLQPAATEYAKAAKLEPTVPEYLGGAGTGAMITKNYDGAVTYFTKAIQMGGKYQEQLQQAQVYQAQAVQLKKYAIYQQKLKEQQKQAPKGSSTDDDD